MLINNIKTNYEIGCVKATLNNNMKNKKSNKLTHWMDGS